MSPEWAPAELDPESSELLPASVVPKAPPVEGSRWKVLRSRALLESMLTGKSVLVSLLVLDPIPDIARMARPPILAYRTKRECCESAI